MFDEFKSAFQRHNNAHAQLIIINVVVFAVVGILGVIFTISGFKEIAWVVQKQFHIPAEFSEFLNRPWTVITYAFMHGGFLHILFIQFSNSAENDHSTTYGRTGKSDVSICIWSCLGITYKF